MQQSLEYGQTACDKHSSGCLGAHAATGVVTSMSTPDKLCTAACVFLSGVEAAKLVVVIAVR